MKTNASLYRCLLGTFLLAAGCSSQRETFADDRDFLECEIRAACGSDNECHEDMGNFDGSDGCYRLDRAKANECLDLLEQRLLEVEQEPETCEENSYYSVCYEALERRSGPGCQSEVVEGRPLLHDGHAVLPAITQGDAWARRTLTLTASDTGTAVAAARYWLNIARTEHASVAAFNQVCLELMSVGAPPQLLQDCQRAALDEIEHARLALDLARGLGDPRWDLGPMPMVPPRTPTLEQIAVDALIEGCIGEGAAAARALVAAERTEGPVADVLRTIAEDETRHATLAWATVRWALERDPGLARPLHEALRRVQAERPRPEPVTTDRSRASLGMMDTAEAAGIERDIIDAIVEPVLAQLLRQTTAVECRV